ncbi:unnamed protein product [Arctogadus glacialis]
MTSGVRVSDEAKNCIESIKIRLTKEDPRDRFKALFFTINEGEIGVDQTLQIKDVDGEDQDAYKVLKVKLQEYQACYVVYDCCYETKETEKNELIFIMWIPDHCKIKSKMLYASSKDSIKQALAACGIKHDWQINDTSDLLDQSAFLSKIAKGIIKLEGKDVKD